MGTVLVVAGLKTTVEALRAALQKMGYAVIGVQSRRQAVRQVRLECPDVVLVDTTSARIDGAQVCYAIRRVSDVPIIAIVRPRGPASAENRAEQGGAELEADYQLVKPYSAQALKVAVEKMTAKPRVIEIGGVRLDLCARRVRGANGQEFPLRPKEFEVLRLLMDNAGRTVTRAEIMREVWQTEYVGDTRTLDVHVRWIREKIEPNPSRPCYLITIRGEGYRFIHPSELDTSDRS